MLCRYIFVCVLLVTSAAVFLEGKYGNYVVKILTCAVQNYKPFVKVAVDHEVLQNGSSIMTFHTVVLKDLGVFGIKIRWFVWDDTIKKYAQAMNLVMRNICEKELAKEILDMMKGLGKNCKVKQGVYNVSVFDLNGLMHTVMRDKFFYGKYRTITDVFTEKYGRVMKINLTLGVNPA